MFVSGIPFKPLPVELWNGLAVAGDKYREDRKANRDATIDAVRKARAVGARVPSIVYALNANAGREYVRVGNEYRRNPDHISPSTVRRWVK